MDATGSQFGHALETTVADTHLALCLAMGRFCGGIFFLVSDQVAALCFVCRARRGALVDLCWPACQQPLVVGMCGFVDGLDGTAADAT